MRYLNARASAAMAERDPEISHPRLNPYLIGHERAEGGWRVVVIDAADEMNPSAANAVLKVLEEPPQRALLFLVAHRVDRLLPTIRSRCRRVDLRPLTETQVRTLLNRYLPSLAADD